MKLLISEQPPQPLRANHSHARRCALLVSQEAARSLFAQLRALMRVIIPRRDKELTRMLRAVRHIQKYVASDTGCGLHGRWRREDLLKVAPV